jgi:hypothetical protein
MRDIKSVEVEMEGQLVFSLFIGKDRKAYVKFGIPYETDGIQLDGIILNSASEVSTFLHDISETLASKLK